MRLPLRPLDSAGRVRRGLVHHADDDHADDQAGHDQSRNGDHPVAWRELARSDGGGLLALGRRGFVDIRIPPVGHVAEAARRPRRKTDRRRPKVRWSCVALGRLERERRGPPRMSLLCGPSRFPSTRASSDVSLGNRRMGCVPVRAPRVPAGLTGRRARGGVQREVGHGGTMELEADGAHTRHDALPGRAPLVAAFVVAVLGGLVALLDDATWAAVAYVAVLILGTASWPVTGGWRYGGASSPTPSCRRNRYDGWRASPPCWSCWLVSPMPSSGQPRSRRGDHPASVRRHAGRCDCNGVPRLVRGSCSGIGRLAPATDRATRSRTTIGDSASSTSAFATHDRVDALYVMDVSGSLVQNDGAGRRFEALETSVAQLGVLASARASTEVYAAVSAFGDVYSGPSHVQDWTRCRAPTAKHTASQFKSAAQRAWAEAGTAQGTNYEAAVAGAAASLRARDAGRRLPGRVLVHRRIVLAGRCLRRLCDQRGQRSDVPAGWPDRRCSCGRNQPHRARLDG